MKTDEEIERERSTLAELIGPTRAGWYAESCQVEYGDDSDAAIWKCRYREMAREAGRLEEEAARMRSAAEGLPDAVRSEISKLLGGCIQVISRPPGGDGSDWWVGLEVEGPHGEFGALWDDSMLSKEYADHIAAECREILTDLLMRAITNAHVR